MSGRAGRRGKDKTGVVIITCSGDTAPDVSLVYFLSYCLSYKSLLYKLYMF